MMNEADKNESRKKMSESHDVVQFLAVCFGLSCRSLRFKQQSRSRRWFSKRHTTHTVYGTANHAIPSVFIVFFCSPLSLLPPISHRSLFEFRCAPQGSVSSVFVLYSVLYESRYKQHVLLQYQGKCASRKKGERGSKDTRKQMMQNKEP